MSMVVYKDLELQIFTLDEKLGLLRTPYYCAELEKLELKGG